MRRPGRVRSKYFRGATLSFPVSHLMVETELPGPRSAWPELRRVSARIGRQVAAAVADGAALHKAARIVRAAPVEEDPWSSWVGAFEEVFGLPAWAREAVVEGERLVRLRLASPYPKATEQWALTALELLWVAARNLAKGPIAIDRAAWQARVSAIGRDLPPRDQMKMHAAIDATDLPWDWLGDDRVAVGGGSHRKQLSLDQAGDARLVQGLARMDCAIPIYTVTGSLGKTSTTRLLAQLMQGSGRRVGMTTSFGAWAGTEQVSKGEAVDGLSALGMLRRPDVDVAVLELARGGLVKSGMPFRQTDVAILLNVLPIHLGDDGIQSVEGLAAVKALTIKPARLAILNHEDELCRQLGADRDGKSCVWFSTRGAIDVLAEISGTARGAIGIARDKAGDPQALTVWEDGRLAKQFPLAEVKPYQGMLGEMTLIELSAAVSAAWFGPVPIGDWQDELRGLRLDATNNPFRTSIHRNGNIIFVLDKGFGGAVFPLLEETIERICKDNGVTHRILVIARSAARPTSAHTKTCAHFHRYMDEFVCFDRPDVYGRKDSLPIYAPGDVPLFFANAFRQLNEEAGVERPVHLAASWEAAENQLRSILSKADAPVLVLVNQPSTDARKLNRAILDFVNSPIQNRS